MSDPKYPGERAMQLSILLSRALPSAAPHRVARLFSMALRCALAHKKSGVSGCDYSRTEAAEVREVRRLARIAAKVDAEAVELSQCSNISVSPVTFCFGGDCRGACGFMLLHGMPGDGLGAPAYPIYF